MSASFDPARRPAAPSPFSRAEDWVAAWPAIKAAEQVEVHHALGRVLAAPVIPRGPLPPRDYAARDGFALRAADTVGAGDYNPLALLLRTAEGVPLGRGQAARVCDGQALPDGADAVLALERAEVRNGHIEVTDAIAAGEAVIPAGGECAAGCPLLDAGRRLAHLDLALLASARLAELQVLRRPRVGLILSGRFELDADGPMLCALLARDGASVEGPALAHGHGTLVEALTQARGEPLAETRADLLVCVGGSGYGQGDHAFAALAELGTVDLDGVAIHPGGGIVLGRIGATPVALLPGAPLAAWGAYELILGGLVRRLAGLPPAIPGVRLARPLARKLVSRIGWLEAARVRLTPESAEPLAVAEERLIASSARSDALVLIPEGSEGHPQGAEVQCILLAS